MSLATRNVYDRSIDRTSLAYDRAGNVLYENNLVASNFSTLYGANGAATQSVYDPLNRMTTFARGTLSASGSNTTTLGAPATSPLLDTITTVNHPSSSEPVSGEQAWSLDQLGNWTSAVTDGTTDTRTHNAQNEVTATSAYTAIGYDNNGNLTTQTGETANVYDAWNRAVGVRGSTFTYDALGRRVTESDTANSQTFLYAGQQMVESVPASGASVDHQQFVYGLDYIDDVVLRDRDTTGSGSLGISGSGLDERLYYTHNREFSVTGIVSQSGSVVERVAYDPYGGVQYFDASYGTPSAVSSYANTVGFTGRWLDPTGMWYFRARYYDPILGRFISRDPLGCVDGESLYCAYFVPVMVDPFGGKSCPGNTPVDVTVSAGGTDFGATPWYTWSWPNYNTQGNLQGIITQIGKQVSACQCIRTLTIASHGDNSHLNLGGDVNEQNRSDFNSMLNYAKAMTAYGKAAGSNNLNVAHEVDANNVGTFGGALNAFCFCPGAKIILLACDSGAGTNSIAQQLANSTGNTVLGSTGDNSIGPSDVSGAESGICGNSNWQTTGTWQTFTPPAATPQPSSSASSPVAPK